MRLRHSATRITVLSILAATGCGGRSGLDGLTPTASFGGLSSFEGITPNGGSPPTVGTTFTSSIYSTGGRMALGGMTATGGSRSTGGSLHTGGLPATGGTKATGGTFTTGGIISTGGTTSIGWGLCNVASRPCNPGDKGIAGPDECPDGGTCYEISNACGPPTWCVASASGTGGTTSGITNTGGAMSTGGVGADDGGSSTGMFGCGDQSCIAYVQYCVVSISDVGGEPNAYFCVTLPQSCLNQLEPPSCDCIAEISCGACNTGSNPGELTDTCPGG